MYEELDSENEGNRFRRQTHPNSQTPRASRSSRTKKKPTTAKTVGGTHNRRNKHWNW